MIRPGSGIRVRVQVRLGVRLRVRTRIKGVMGKDVGVVGIRGVRVRIRISAVCHV